MSQYQERLKAHLASYRHEVLGLADELVGGPGRPHAHIVPADKRHLNLIAAYRPAIVAWLSKQPRLQLHRDFHHLACSQAMAINLFFPALVSPAGRAALAQALPCPPVADTSPLFESTPDPIERTTFDLHLQATTGAQLYFDIKLAEDGFGRGRPDAEHPQGLDDVTLARLQERLRPQLLAPASLLHRAPLFRKLAYLQGDDDRLVLVLPLANRALHSQAEAFVADLDEPVRRQVAIVAVEALVDRLRAASPAGEVAWAAHYDEFRRKYEVEVPVAA